MPTDFLQLAGKTVLVCGVANRKSVAWHIAKLLVEADCRVIFSVRSEARREQGTKLVQGMDGSGGEDVIVCDMEFEEQIKGLAEKVASRCDLLHGVVHSIAFGDYSEGPRPFHETSKQQLLSAVDISCFSLIALSNALKDQLARDASVVTVSISTTRMASENYGFMAPVKAALDSSLAFLAKSFSQFSEVRFNAVAPGLLKTSASAGIPGYVDSYLFAEQATLRQRAVQTEEVAAAAAFLLSSRSSGMNSQRLVLDAGMETNYFDQRIVQNYLQDGQESAQSPS